MRGAGALFASIGTSAMLVAAVALSLLTVSAVFALNGIAGSSDAGSADALVLDLQGHSASHSAHGTHATAVAVVAPQAPRHSSSAAARTARRGDPVQANSSSTTSTATSTSQVAALGPGASAQPPAARQPDVPAAAATPAPKNLGEDVKQLGDGLSSTVQQAGTALAKITAPLGPPVSVAVQQVLNIVAALVKSVTGTVGGVLGAKP